MVHLRKATQTFFHPASCSASLMKFADWMEQQAWLRRVIRSLRKSGHYSGPLIRILGLLSERFHSPAHCRVLPVLHLYPVLRLPSLIRAVAALGSQSLEKTHPARGPEEIRP